MNSRKWTGACHPPRNKVMPNPLIANIPMYSAMKNVAYLNPEYSAMCPATISDSPSGTSNGVRFDSAKPETKNRMNATPPHGENPNQRANMPYLYTACEATIPSGLGEPTANTTGRKVTI